MKIDFERRTWKLELDEATVEQAEAIGAFTGLSLFGWYKSLIDVDAGGWLKSMRCLYWLMHEQNDESVVLESANFAPMKLLTAFNDGAKAENGDAEAVEEDPTRPAGELAAEQQATPGTGSTGSSTAT